jgi:hypothetical protein
MLSRIDLSLIAYKMYRNASVGLGSSEDQKHRGGSSHVNGLVVDVAVNTRSDDAFIHG